MSLDLDGILNVTAIEKKSGLSKNITIARALEAKSATEIAAARKRLESLFAGRVQDDEFAGDAVQALPAPAQGSRDWGAAEDEGRQIVDRARRLLDQVHEEDREQVIDLNQAIESAIEGQDDAALKQAVTELRELLFFVEGRV
jgi:molecular chaperone DnaK (HSP70)